MIWRRRKIVPPQAILLRRWGQAVRLHVVLDRLRAAQGSIIRVNAGAHVFRTHAALNSGKHIGIGWRALAIDRQIKLLPLGSRVVRAHVSRIALA